MNVKLIVVRKLLCSPPKKSKSGYAWTLECGKRFRVVSLKLYASSRGAERAGQLASEDLSGIIVNITKVETK